MSKRINVEDKFIGYGYENLFKDVNDNNIDLYHKYLFDLIMESDHFMIDYELNFIKKIKKERYDYIYLFNGDLEIPSKQKNIYDISDNNSKKFLINNLIICITDEEFNPYEHLNKKISNDLKNKWIYLLKKNTLFASIMLYSGYVNDRRDWNEIKNQKSKLSGLRYIPKILEINKYRINGEEYRYSVLFNDLKNDSKKDNELLINNLLKRDNGKLEKYLDIFRNYIFDLIEECDHFIIEEMNMREYFYYKKYLNYEYYDKIMYRDTKSTLFSRRLFDISTKDNKDILKKKLKFNINDTDNEYIELHVNRDYIHNNREDYNDGNSIHFIKEGKVLFSLETNTGDITDYRDKNQIEKSIEKYRKIK